MNSILNRIVLFIFSFFISLNYSWSQCAMCKATVENNGEIGETEYGYNINIGILFLMIVPYIILFFAFRKKIKKVINEVRSAKG